MVKNSDKTWSTGKENGKLLQHSCLENLINSTKRQKGTPLKDEPHPRLVGVQYATRDEQRIAPEGMKRLGTHGAAQLWMCLVVKLKYNAVKNNVI